MRNMGSKVNSPSERRTAIPKTQTLPKLPLAQLERLITQSLDQNKAEQIISIDLTGKSDFADRMVIASGTSARHVSALADHVKTALKSAGFVHVPTEGQEAGDWVLVDAGDIIVHIFRPDMRVHYNLEKMWSVAVPSSAEAAH
jgi:ribosome-associated protein